MTERVALVAHRLAEASPTGIGRYYRELARELAAEGDPARRYVLASTREAQPPAWAPAEFERRSLGGPRKVRALGWAVTGRPPVDGALGAPDLVHLLHPWTVLPSRAPLVTTVHDLMPMQHPSWYPRGEGWLLRRGLRHAADHAELVVVNSTHTAHEVSAELGVDPARIRVTWFGVGAEFRARPAPGVLAALTERVGVRPGEYLVTVGTVSTRKNLGVVLRALSAIDPAVRPHLLVIGPPGDGAGSIEADVDRLGLTDGVHFAGFVAPAELPVLVAGAAALAHPSRAEGFGMTPLEAMAAGVPALASDVGAVREVTGAAAVLLGPDDEAGWAGAIVDVLTDPDRRAALVATGDAHQAQFTWARTAAATRAVHDEVLSR